MNTDLPVITTMIGNKKAFVRLSNDVLNGMYSISEYAPSADAATHFSDLEQAERLIPKIYNRHNREFKAEITTVEIRPLPLDR